jgi:hypothetical protein
MDFFREVPLQGITDMQFFRHYMKSGEPHLAVLYLERALRMKMFHIIKKHCN